MSNPKETEAVVGVEESTDHENRPSFDIDRQMPIGEVKHQSPRFWAWSPSFVHYDWMDSHPPFDSNE
ncbi:hypothetical protein [Paraburkholderia terrae]|uniref:hypothetical protein n=1 Tax=Paraburkholderia terrae TaxID=311230 RepID=UPI0020C024A1|nr:hypothetical protein [Paraburkholderia terrae]